MVKNVVSSRSKTRSFRIEVPQPWQACFIWRWGKFKILENFNFTEINPNSIFFLIKNWCELRSRTFSTLSHGFWRSIDTGRDKSDSQLSDFLSDFRTGLSVNSFPHSISIILHFNISQIQTEFSITSKMFQIIWNFKKILAALANCVQWVCITKPMLIAWDL